MTRIYIAVDNGIDGAVCAVGANGYIDSFRSPHMPAGRGSSRRLDPSACYTAVYRLIEEARSTSTTHDSPVILLLEPASKHSPGGNAVASTHHSAGIWFAVASILPMAGLGKVGYHEVPAVTWQAEMLGKFPKGESKIRAEVEARRLFGNVIMDRLPRQGPKTPRPHDGAIDALLIAEWGRRKNI